MTQAFVSKLFIGSLLIAAGAAQAASPTSVSEAPAAWYADRIMTSADTRGAMTPVFPAASYEHGITVQRQIEVRPTPSHAGASLPFPSSAYEHGSVL